jgi:hypothetical protein
MEQSKENPLPLISSNALFIHGSKMPTSPQTPMLLDMERGSNTPPATPGAPRLIRSPLQLNGSNSKSSSLPSRQFKTNKLDTKRNLLRE